MSKSEQEINKLIAANIAARKQKADVVRLKLMSLDDEVLINFSNAIQAGETFKGRAFEDVESFMNRTVDEFLESMPF